MKLFKSIMTLATAALFAACQTDIDTPQIGNSADFVAPVLGACGDVIVNADNADSENVIFSWTAASFGLPVQVLYQVYLVRDGVEALAGATNSTSIAIGKDDLNGVVINGLGVAAGETAEVTAYVSATVANSTKYAPVNSEQSAPFSVTTYDAPLRWRYLCGEINDWNTATAPIFWETAAGTNIYECMVDFTPNCVNNPPSDPENYSFFKVLENADWYGYDKITPIEIIKEKIIANERFQHLSQLRLDIIRAETLLILCQRQSKFTVILIPDKLTHQSEAFIRFNKSVVITNYIIFQIRSEELSDANLSRQLRQVCLMFDNFDAQISIKGMHITFAYGAAADIFR